MSVLKLLNLFSKNFSSKDMLVDSRISISFEANSANTSVRIYDPESGSFSFKIFDSSMNFLGTIKVQNGITSLPFLPSGKYFFKLIGSGEQVIKKGKFNVV
jgi:hypothetical protein